ncbi:hypothetical protein FA15DRAFT_675740 [Coprinopsis marcescibilis]|uniref:CBM1 domain-containing protein n=1 Tax=Coprinopsis marcescibilis TaxID=230819 RepID=A0A5C3KD31_COPMA|nr:hypothetical protein FA15DRAFT_675740 [Coprinopsis marcescibilis]
MNKYFVTLLAIFAVGAMAAPQSTTEPLRCDLEPNGRRCPPGFTCCGPVIDGVGGTCQQLGNDFFCPT